jgi:TolB-like protein
LKEFVPTFSRQRIMDELKRIIREIHGRSLWQVLGIYLAGSWIALQVVEIVVETASLPDWLPGMALVLLIIGLPVVMATAFVSGGASEPVPIEESTRASEPAPAPKAGPASLLTWRFALGGGVAASAFWGLVAAILLLNGGMGSGTGDGEGRLAIAVLPFASAGADEDDESFALGIHDDVLTQLSKVGSLRVISRTSVMEYKDYSQNVRDIANKLGADVILEGSVQRAGDQLHINAQLIDTREEEGHLWAESFDRRLTVANIFLIQQELAGRIASALDATLTPEEREEVGAAPTENMEAYTLYQRGNNYFNVSPRAQDFQIAFDLFEQATELDPGFAQAYARYALARARAFEVRPGLGGLEDARRVAELALALDPDNAEAHLAKGQYLYSGFRDYEGALREIGAAREAGLSSSVDLYHNLAATQRRMGDFDGAIESFQEAVRLDPLSAHMLEDLGSTYAHTGRHEEAIDVFRRALTLAPDVGPYTFMFGSLLNADGNTTRARALIDELEASTGDRYGWMDVTVREFDGDLQGAAHIADSLEFRGNWMGALLAGVGRRDEAEARFRGQLEFSQGRLAELDASEQLARFPARARTLIDIAEAQSGLGMFEEAAAAAEAAMDALPVGVDAMDGPDVMYDAAGVLVAVGRLDRAVEVLTAFFAGPGEQSFAYLEMDPAFDALRDHPGYSELGR